MAPISHQTHSIVHPPEEAYLIDDDGQRHIGKLFFIEEVRSSGLLRATYEYNIYYWPHLQSWSGDVISPHGWHDLEQDELERLVRKYELQATD